MSYHRMWSQNSRYLVAWWLVALGLAATLAGCARGNIQTTATGGVGGRIGDIVVRDASITFDRPIAADAVYQPGDDAALRVTIVNDGNRADRLVRVTSPMVRSSTITGDTRIPGHQTLTTGYPGTNDVRIVLTGLLEPIRAGLGYPVVFVFEQAGKLRLELPVENPNPPRR